MAGELVSVVPASGYYPVRILNALPTNTTFGRKGKQFTSGSKNIVARHTSSSMSNKLGDKNEKMERRSYKEYLEHSKDLVGSSDGGPPRWFSPLECSSTLEHSPLLLSLPGSLIYGACIFLLMTEHHSQGEEYKLFWPEQSEFIRMAARFGAKIIPFGVVGEDDVSQLLLDYDDLIKIPFLESYYKEFNESFIKLRTGSSGEIAKQDLHLPILLPKVPGRFYFLFGKPIETEGRKQELRTREKSNELYREVKSEVENYLAYLKEKRENDPYRSILARQVYQAIHGPDAQVPTFSL